MKRIKICVVTGTRAEFGLLTPLLKLIQNEDAFTLQLLVTGMHLSPEFGNTYKYIEAAGFEITEKVEMLLSADTDTAVVKSTALGMIGYADALDRLQPDWILLLGDRFEVFAAAAAAYLKKIPIAHLHGGEVTAGATDEALRHSVTKMATLHFTSTEEYRKRVMQLGENEENIFSVGAIGLDNINDLVLLDRPQLEASLNLTLSDPVLLITYHPVTLEVSTGIQQMQSLLDALDEFGQGQLIFTMPNADAGGRDIIKMITAYVAKNPGRAYAYTSLGQLRYLSLMKQAAAVIGNSSSGIIEAPSFCVPSINIGDRQKGRIAASSVIHTNTDTASVVEGLQKAFDPAFRTACQKVNNPYGKGGVAKKIMAILQERAANPNLKKVFVDRI